MRSILNRQASSYGTLHTSVLCCCAPKLLIKWSSLASTATAEARHPFAVPQLCWLPKQAQLEDLQAQLTDSSAQPPASPFKQGAHPRSGTARLTDHVDMDCMQPAHSLDYIQPSHRSSAATPLHSTKHGHRAAPMQSMQALPAHQHSRPASGLAGRHSAPQPTSPLHEAVIHETQTADGDEPDAAAAASAVRQDGPSSLSHAHAALQDDDNGHSSLASAEPSNNETVDLDTNDEPTPAGSIHEQDSFGGSVTSHSHASLSAISAASSPATPSLLQVSRHGPTSVTVLSELNVHDAQPYHHEHVHTC